MAANSQYIQKLNRLRVLNYVRKYPGTSRPTIACGTDLSLASMTNITSYLIEKKLLKECGTENSEGAGRKSTLLKFNAQSFNLICVFISYNTVDFSYTDLNGNILERFCVGFTAADSENLEKTIGENILRLTNRYDTKKIIGISIIISGIILNNNQFLFSSTHRLREFNPVDLLEKETGIPVFLYNPSAVKATFCVCCSQNIEDRYSNIIFIDLDGGIGACQFYRGELNSAMLGEIGHTTVEKDGEPCFCGNRGCLEAMCSPSRITRLYKEYSGAACDDIDFEYVAGRYKAGDTHAYDAVNECAQYLGIAFANLMNLFKPTTIIINIGDFAPLRDVVEKAKRIMHERAYPSLLDNIVIKEINMGVDDTIKGAAYASCDRIFDASHYDESQISPCSFI